ncbi:MAG: hypothetical protein ACRECX_01145 [Methyloceanibacter sp.]|uniref:hypothetical protein n=1 Tax=Methyloceanibacter sp. TaxID=1965321 RepID=UPI003D6D43D1
MRVAVTVAALIAGGLLIGASSGPANAAPRLALSSSFAASSAVETIGWQRRYYRRYGNLPYAPPAVVDEEVIVADDGTVIVVPIRPLSCGEFRYWNGTACVDARYNTPYLGPR